MPAGPDYSFRWNNYDHPNLVLAYDMSTRTPAGLMKNLARTGAVYDGTINGVFTPANPLIRAKKTPCMDLNGANNYLSLVNPISGATDYSIVLWVNHDGLNGVFYSEVAGATAVLYVDSAIGLGLLSGGTFMYQANPRHQQVISKTYMIVAARRSSSGLGYLYIDGKLYCMASLGAMVVDANCYIGQYWNGGLRLNGCLDNMMFFNIALTPEQVWTLYRSANMR